MQDVIVAFLKDWSPPAIVFLYFLLKKDIGHIDKQLSNHITDTNKKIETLKADMKEDVRELKSGQTNLAEGQIKLEANLEAKLEKKIDNLFKIYLKKPAKQ